MTSFAMFSSEIKLPLLPELCCLRHNHQHSALLSTELVCRQQGQLLVLLDNTPGPVVLTIVTTTATLGSGLSSWSFILGTLRLELLLKRQLDQGGWRTRMEG